LLISKGLGMPPPPWGGVRAHGHAGSSGARLWGRGWRAHRTAHECTAAARHAARHVLRKPPATLRGDCHMRGVCHIHMCMHEHTRVWVHAQVRPHRARAHCCCCCCCCSWRVQAATSLLPALFRGTPRPLWRASHLLVAATKQGLRPQLASADCWPHQVPVGASAPHRTAGDLSLSGRAFRATASRAPPPIAPQRCALVTCIVAASWSCLCCSVRAAGCRTA
jgi:hypothetical protein